MRSYRVSSAEPKEALAFASKALICYIETQRFREGKTLAPGHTASLGYLNEVSKS